MRIAANGLRRGVAFIFKTILSETIKDEGLNIRRND
jgi:hypothetical protein